MLSEKELKEAIQADKRSVKNFEQRLKELKDDIRMVRTECSEGTDNFSRDGLAGDAAHRSGT